MARPESFKIASTGLTELNPELAPERALVEYVSQRCEDRVLTLEALSLSMDWVETRETHGPTGVQRKIQSPKDQERSKHRHPTSTSTATRMEP